jgi:type I restriction enzyme M protein
MDAEAEEMGGTRSFFAGDYAKYGWSKLMAPGMGGFDVLALYSEAIGKMNENPGIPALFRDIFKNAYLPYRDPETLRAFLKEIDSFTYDHSERLGDAFEYLLSVLGSQGDAGQFRTPRHIIDFMVEIIDPKKNETLLDPACGTAGFLISAWKHIIKSNTSLPSPASGGGAGGEGKPLRTGDQLSPDERKQLAANIHGYDISPDMVRLSLVNMYLHGFTDPHIDEYDTLTSEERWHHYADIILANPPFMSPKGGIKPHKRFSVQATRSEVLFVDYIAEHLTPTGRAAVIVPEGIIFQSQTAYKALRKLLVENYLVAVVSLPAGVFQPYSGVKTSILILDKTLAKKADNIGFFKVENDGFGLGAQRRPIDKNDLPQIRGELGEYLRRLRAGEPVAEFQPTLGLIVAKAKVEANEDYNLSGERYREAAISTSRFPSVALGEICELIRGVVYSKEDEVSEGGVQVLRANNINKDRYELNLDDIKRVSPKTDFSEDKQLKNGDIFICLASGSKDHIGKVALIAEDTDYFFGGFMGAIRVKSDRVLASYLFKQLTSGHFNDFLREQIAGANINNLNGGLLYRFCIPLPPRDVQIDIMAEIDGYQSEIDRLNDAIQVEKKKIQATLARIWGEPETAPAEP